MMDSGGEAMASSFSTHALPQKLMASEVIASGMTLVGSMPSSTVECLSRN
jgi:hypothetical protein